MDKTWKTPKGTELPLMDIRGKDYLTVAWRLVWFHEEKPTWSILTEFVELTAVSAFAKATIINERNQIMSTGHKFEDKQGFPDFREKSETGAIGRALALIGYGTQFCADEFDEGTRLTDSPVVSQKSVVPYQTPSNQAQLITSIAKPPVIKPAVAPRQPGPNDGITEEYCCSANLKAFPSLVRRPISKCDPAILRDAVNTIEADAKTKGIVLSPWKVEFIMHADPIIAAWENKQSDVPNWDEPGSSG